MRITDTINLHVKYWPPSILTLKIYHPSYKPYVFSDAACCESTVIFKHPLTFLSFSSLPPLLISRSFYLTLFFIFIFSLVFFFSRFLSLFVVDHICVLLRVSQNPCPRLPFPAGIHHLWCSRWISLPYLLCVRPCMFICWQRVHDSDEKRWDKMIPEKSRRKR